MKKNVENLTLILTLFAILLGNLAISKYVFMLTDGWWEVYSWLNAKGYSLYNDPIYLRFPPLFVIITEQFSPTFNLLDLRYAWSFVQVANAYILYKFLRQYSGALPSIIAVSLTVGFVLSNPVYIPKDYHSLVSLLVTSVFYFISKSDFLYKNSDLMIVSFFLGLLVLTKQNIGVFFSSSVILYIIVNNKDTLMSRFKKLIFILIFFIIPICIALVWDKSWVSSYIGNDAKGNPLTVLFRFITDETSVKYLIYTLILIGILNILSRLEIQTSSNQNIKFKNLSLSFSKLEPSYLFLLLYILVIFLAVVIIKKPSLIIVFSLAWPFIRLGYAKNKLLWIPLYGFVYCGTMTAGYNSVSTDILVALFIAEFTQIIVDKYKINTTSIYLVFIGFLGFFLVTQSKYLSNVGYDWWGLKSGSIKSAHNCNLDFNYLKGFCTDKETSEIVRAIYDEKNNIRNTSKVFAYPNVPVVYKLLNVNPYVPPVLWFDVTTTGQGVNTVSTLKKMPPDYIFWMKPPSSVYEGHFNLLRKPPAMENIDNWIRQSLIQGRYKVDKVLITYQDNLSVIKNNFISIEAANDELKVSELKFYKVQDFNEYVKDHKSVFNSNQHIFYILKKNDS